MTNADVYARADEAAEALRERCSVDHQVAVVLGSGWRPAADRLGEVVEAFPCAELPGFPAPTVDGHSAEIRSILAGDVGVLAFMGRVHAYEGHPLADVVHGVRTAVRAGCRVVVLTNAAGGISAGLEVGQPVLIADQLNLTGRSPLTGPTPDPGIGPRFPDLSDLYSRRLRDRVRAMRPELVEGVYAGVNGPQYETPAEIRMMQGLGADLVGMSTVHEATAAAHLGAEVLGISLVTNLAAGLGDALDHADVLRVAGESAEAMGALLADLVPDL